MAAVLPPGPFHVSNVSTHSIGCGAFELLGLASSLCLDFQVRTTGKPRIPDLYSLISLPAADSPWLYPLAMVALRMNCVTSHYAPLWEEVTAHYGVGSQWSRDHAPRTDAARRALEIDCDALATLAYGLTADELCAIYTTQFAVLHGYERDNRYDRNGRMLPSAVQRLARKLGWNDGQPAPPPTRDGEPGDEPWTVAVDLPDGTRTGAIAWDDPKLFPRTVRTYLPPFTGNDREADMRAAIERWQHWRESGAPRQLPYGDRA